MATSSGISLMAKNYSLTNIKSKTAHTKTFSLEVTNQQAIVTSHRRTLKNLTDNLPREAYKLSEEIGVKTPLP
jgi:hypothetical protein